MAHGDVRRMRARQGAAMNDQRTADQRVAKCPTCTYEVRVDDSGLCTICDAPLRDPLPSKPEVSEADYWRGLWEKAANAAMGLQADVERLTAELAFMTAAEKERTNGLLDSHEREEKLEAERERLRAAGNELCAAIGILVDYSNFYPDRAAEAVQAWEKMCSPNIESSSDLNRTADETSAAILDPQSEYKDRPKDRPTCSCGHCLDCLRRERGAVNGDGCL